MNNSKKVKNDLNKREKEIASIAASVAAGCLGCLEYHKQKAIDIEISQEELLQVARIAMIIRNKADKHTINDLDTILLEESKTITGSGIKTTDSMCCEE
jgi:AhpD family alkylhydroperoxidase